MAQDELDVQLLFAVDVLRTANSAKPETSPCFLKIQPIFMSSLGVDAVWP